MGSIRSRKSRHHNVSTQQYYVHDFSLINIQDKWSALLLAARHGRTKVVEVLLNAGASMTVSNKVRGMPLNLHWGISVSSTKLNKAMSESHNSK